MNKTNLISDVFQAMCLYSIFTWLKCNFVCDRIFIWRPLPNAVPQLSSAHLRTFTFVSELPVARSSCVTATVNLHSIANSIAFHNFWKHKSDRRFEQFLTLIWADSISEHSGWYFWHFCQYPEEVSDILMQVQYFFLQHSLIFTSFNDMSVVCLHLNV